MTANIGIGIATIAVTVLLWILSQQNNRIGELEKFNREQAERRRDPRDLVQIAKLTQAIIQQYSPKTPERVDQ